MCIGVWSLEHPDYALILGANRDEFLDRPTKNAEFHSFDATSTDERGYVLSGLDVLGGGSWLGLNRDGRVALLTNITETPHKHKTSRGDLVASFLLSDPSQSLEEVVENIITQNGEFAGFNLLLLAPARTSSGLLQLGARLVTNHGSGGDLTSRCLTSEERVCGAISNGVDEVDLGGWPKVKHASRGLDAIFQSLTPGTKESELTNNLFDLLAWQSPDPVRVREELRNTVQVAPLQIIQEGTTTTGVMHSVYGTRLSTVLLIGRKGEVLFIERDIWQMIDGQVVQGDPAAERRYRFNINL